MEVADLYATLGLKVQVAEWNAGDQRLKGMEKSLNSVEGAAGKAAGALKLISVAAIAMIGTEVLEFFGGLIEKTMSSAVETSHLAERLGVSTEAVQQLGYAADVSGVKAETLQGGMQRLARGLDEVKTKGTGPVAGALHKLGISLDDPAIKAGNLDDKLMRIADGFANAGPNVDKLALSMQIFGRSAGPAMIPLLNKGSDGIAKLRKEFVDLGAQIDGETTEQFKKLEEDQKRLQYTMIGFRNQAVMALIPVLQEAAEAALEWFKANRVEIINDVRKGIEALVAAFRFLAEVMGDIIDFGKAVWSALSVIIDAVSELTAKSETLKYVLEAVAVVAGVLAVVLLAPWIAVAAAVAALILIVEDLYSMFIGGPSILGDAFEALKAWFDTTMPNAVKVWWNTTAATFKFLIDQLEEFIDNVKDAYGWFVKITDLMPGFSLTADLYRGKIGDDIGTLGRAATGDHGSSSTSDPVANFFNGGANAAPSGPGTENADSSIYDPVSRAIAQGGGATPTVQAPQFSANIIVNAGDGADPAAMGKSITDQLHTFWDSKMRELQATTPKP